MNNGFLIFLHFLLGLHIPFIENKLQPLVIVPHTTNYNLHEWVTQFPPLFVIKMYCFRKALKSERKNMGTPFQM